MSKWIWALLIVVALGVVGYFTGVVKFSGNVDVREDGKVIYEAGTPSHNHENCGGNCNHDH